MAIVPSSSYPGQSIAGDPGFPYGKPRNITVTADGTGYPWNATTAGDIVGMQQALLVAGGVTPSGSPDSASASDYLTALHAVITQRNHRFAIANHEQRSPGGSPSALYGLLATPTRLVAVGQAGASGSIETSTDGSTWTARAGGSGDSYRDAAWNGSVYVVVGTAGNGRIRTSPDTVTWTDRVAGAGFGFGTFHGVCWNGTLFVAVGGGFTETSPTGTTWTERVTGGGVVLMNAVAWSGSIHVAVGNSGRIETSPDGITWTLRTPAGGYTGNFEDVTWANGIFVAVGMSGGIQTSPDGINWTACAPVGTPNFYSVCWTGSVWVVLGSGGTALQVSPNLTSWTSIARASYTNTIRAARLYQDSVVMVSSSSADIQQSQYFG